MNLLRKLFVVAALAATSTADAARHEFPSVPWSSIRLVRSDLTVDAVDHLGGRQFRFMAEPRGCIGEIDFKVTEGGLSIDPTRAFASGLKKLVCTSPEMDDPSFDGQYVVYEADVAGPPPASIISAITMQREVSPGKKSFHCVFANRSRPFVLFSGRTPRRCRAVMLLSDKTSGYALRFDITAPAKEP